MGRAGKDKTARKKNCFPGRGLPKNAIRVPSGETRLTFLVPQIGMKPMDNTRATVLPLQRWSRWLAPPVGWALYGLMTMGMLAWTWMTWPDSIVDFGKELYVAWQIAAGQHLYLDLAHYSGPFSSYLNGLWFRWMGTSIHSLLGLNFVLWILLFWLLRRTLSKMAGPLAVFVAMSFFILVFSFGQYAGIGNYNYLAPYAHELTHGLLLSLGAMLFAHQWMGSGRVRDAGGSGFCLGLSCLTKPEVALPGLAAVGVGVLAQLWINRGGRCSDRVGIAVLALSFAGTVLAALALVSGPRPWGVAWGGILTPWRNLWLAPLVHLPFFRELSGLDRPAANLGMMLRGVLAYAAAFSVFYAASRFLRKRAAVAVALGLGAMGIATARYMPWEDLARPFPVFMGIGLAASAWSMWPRPAVKLANDEWLRGMFGVFGFTLLLKILLNARIGHYGFVLAMPASLYLIVAVMDWIPQRFSAHPDRGLSWRIAMVAVLGVLVVHYWSHMSGLLAVKQVRMGEGGDSFRADASGYFIEQFIQGARQIIPANSTMAVVPEGAMLNYRLRLVNPTPYTNLMPPEMLVFGEGRIVEDFRRNPPDYIALVHKDTTEFGARFFGRDYGRSLARWIKDHYQEIYLVGNAPFVEPKRFGLLLLKQMTPSEDLPATTVSTPR